MYEHDDRESRFCRHQTGNVSRKHHVMTQTFGYELDISGGTRYRRRLRYYRTSRKIVGSIPNEVIGFFNLNLPNLRLNL
jgi:hypothetical protein